MRTRLGRFNNRNARYKTHNVPVLNHRCADSLKLAAFTIRLVVHKRHGWRSTISNFKATTILVSALSRQKSARSLVETLTGSHVGFLSLARDSPAAASASSFGFSGYNVLSTHLESAAVTKHCDGRRITQNCVIKELPSELNRNKPTNATS